MLLGEPVGVERGVHRAHVTDRSAPRDRRADRAPASVSYPFAMTFAHDGARPKLSVLGTGYLGATHAVSMVELGYDVLGLDVDEAKIARLSAGEVPFFEPGLPELLRKALDSGRLRFTTSYAGGGRLRRRALHLRRHAAAQGRLRGRPDVRRVGVLDAGAAARPARAGRGQVDGAGRHRGADVRAGRPRRPVGPRSRSPGTRSSCGRASPSRTPCTRTGWCSACSRPRAEADAAGRVRAGDRGRDARSW